MSRNVVIEQLRDELTPKSEAAPAVQVSGSALAPRHPVLPAEAQADFATGLELIGIGEPRQAAEHLERALQVAPGFADVHIAVGVAYAVEGKIYSALDHLGKATKLDPRSFFAHFKLGQLYFKLRVPKKGYDEMVSALDCATSVRERGLVAQLVREERQREHSGIRRPWWNKPFSRKALYFAASLGAVAAVFLLRFMHLR